MSLVDSLYQSISEADKPREIKSWHASSIAQCPKAQYMARLGIESYTKPTGAKILRWSVGHAVEAGLRPHLKKLYPKLVSNKRIYSKEYDLSGEFDNYHQKTKTLIEVKSVAPYAINHLKKDPKPYLAHEWQQHAYALLADVERIIYVYASLDGLLMSFETLVKSDIRASVVLRLTALQAAWRDQQPPPCICVESNPLWKSVLQFCPYKSENGCCVIS